MDLILQDLDKIDQFHHNYEMMTHGETSRSGFNSTHSMFLSMILNIDNENLSHVDVTIKTRQSHDKRSPENAMMMDFFKKRGNSAMNDYLARFRLP